ncbi:MAG: hypothetical protein AAFY88_27790, partial [Acidobacteriota bacterium]
MSFHSCHRYVFGLPTSTLEGMVRGALAEDETAGVSLTFTSDGVPIGGGLTANVTASVTETENATLEVPGTDLDLFLGLAMRLEVEVVEMPALDPIEYQVGLEIPGEFGRREEPGVAPELIIHFPLPPEVDLGVDVTGGEILLTGDLLQPLIDAAVAANPDLLGPKESNFGFVPVTTEIFHDDPGAPGFRGRITGAMPDAETLVLTIPGSILAPLIDSDMTVTAAVPVVTDDDAGELRVHFDQVTE